MKRFELLAAVALALCTFSATPASAQSGESDSVTLAREKFRGATTLAGAGRWADAAVLYLEAQRLFPSPATLLNLGFCYEQLGDPASAYRFTAAALATSDPERRLDAAHQEQALEALEALDARIGIVTFEADAETQLVRVGDASLVAGTARGEPLLFVSSEPVESSWSAQGARLVLNAGRYTLSLRGQRGDVLRELTVREGERQTLSVRAPQAAEPSSTAAAPPKTPARPKPIAPASPVSAGSDSRSGLWQAGKISLLVAGGAALVGAGAGVVAWSTKRELDEACAPSGACPPSADAARSRFDTAATVANVGFAAAAVAGAAGLTLLLLGDAPVPAQPSVALRITGDRASFVGRF